MKKLCTVILTMSLCLMLLVPVMAAGESEEVYPVMAANNTIVVSNGKDAPDAHLVHPAVYKIDGANYFKLRDLGEALDFHMGCDDETKTVCISGARGYEKEA